MALYKCWTRGEAKQLSTHFNTREFTCKCGSCSLQVVQQELIDRLERLREDMGLPIIIHSGKRCNRWQQVLKGQGYETATGPSTHEDGRGVDISCSDMEYMRKLVPRHFDSYGLANTFIHVDTRGPRPDGTKRTWKYGS